MSYYYYTSFYSLGLAFLLLSSRYSGLSSSEVSARVKAHVPLESLVNPLALAYEIQGLNPDVPTELSLQNYANMTTGRNSPELRVKFQDKNCYSLKLPHSHYFVVG